jgi:glycosyltransferase involved in cell wall biosynthesis
MAVTRICILIKALKKGGAEKQSMLLARIINQDYQLIFIVQNGKKPEAEYLQFLQENQIPFFLLQGNLVYRLLKVFKILKEQKIQLIFSYLTSDNLWACLIGKLADVKYIAGGIRNQRISFIKFLVNKWLHDRFLDFIVFNSKAGMNAFLKNGFKPEKSLLIQNYLDTPAKEVRRQSSNTLTILSVGRFVRQKDFLTAIQSVRKLKKELQVDQPIHFLIAGFGPLEKKIKRWIRLYKLGGITKIHRNPENMDQIYRMSDVYLSTSIYEGFSNSIMEAMSYSLPVVATNVGDNNCLIEHGNTGFLTSPKDVKGITQYLTELLRSAKLREQMGSEGFKKLKREFNSNVFRGKYIRFITSLD